MVNNEITFNDLPKVIAELRDEVIGMKVALLDLQKGQTQHKMGKLRRTHAPEHSLHEVAEGRSARYEARQAMGAILR